MLFREHDGIDFQTPAEMAGVNPPFKDWDDVVRVAATDTKGKGDVPDMAEVADRSERRGESTASPTTHFVLDPTRRRRPKGETDTDDPDEEWPPTPATVKRWRDDDGDMPVPSVERRTAPNVQARRSDIGTVYAGRQTGGGHRRRPPAPKGRVTKPRKRRTSKHASLQQALRNRGRRYRNQTD